MIRCPICYLRYQDDEKEQNIDHRCEFLNDVERMCTFCVSHPWFQYSHFSKNLAERMIEALPTMDQKDLVTALQFILKQCSLNNSSDVEYE